jgi:hypothetical protein
MVQAVDQAQRERELTKQALAGDIDRLEARIRAELDWKARLRRDGVKYALAGGVLVGTVVGVVVLRRVLRGDKSEPAPSPTTLQEMAAELAAIRKQLDHAKIDADTGPVWQKIALRAVSAAAAAGGTFAARRFMARAEAAPAGPAELG